MGTLIVGIFVLAIVGLAVHSIWKDKKSGKTCSGCGGGCSKCKEKN